MTTTTTDNAVKFLKKGIKTTDGRYFPCHYSMTKLIDDRVAVTIYARSLLKGLPAELSPINQSDMQTDYFENDRVRFFEGSAEFEQLKGFCT